MTNFNQYGNNQYGVPNYGYPGYTIQPQQPLASQPVQQPTTGMNWVQGEAGANAYLVAPGCVAVLFDSTRQVFYIKSVDQNGKPNPLEAYDYSRHEEQQQPQPDMSQYVTKDELQNVLKELTKGKAE